MSLAPEIEAFLKRLDALNLPQVWQAPVDEIRRNTQGRTITSGPVENILETSNRFIPGPTADLPIRIYRPTVATNAPAIVYFHGGGWVLNFLDIYDASLARLANQSGATIIAVNYQKAPEHPFPIPFDDCYATLLWVVANATNLGIDENRIGVAGDSAGGNLAAAVALKARDNDIALSHHDENPYAIPMRASSFKALAPAIIITAQYDPLLNDGERYAELLHRDGVPVLYKGYEGMIHGFFTNMAITPTAQQAIDFIAYEVKKMTQ